MCESKLIFNGPLLDKLTKNCVLSMNDKLVKQIEGCPMGGAISVIMSGIHMKRMETDCVAPLNQKLYKRYVDDKRTKRMKNTWNDKLFANTNSHHKNIKITVETNQSDFLTQPLMLFWWFCDNKSISETWKISWLFKISNTSKVREE